MPKIASMAEPWSLEIDQRFMEVWSNSSRTDENWRYTDANGDEHYWADNDYPTLVWVVDRTYWCEGCSDEHEEGHHECPVCGEHIVPGRLPPSPFPTTIPGIRDGRLIYDNGSERSEYAITSAEDMQALEDDLTTNAPLVAERSPIVRREVRFSSGA